MNKGKEKIPQLDAKPEGRASLCFWVNLGPSQHKRAPLSLILDSTFLRSHYISQGKARAPLLTLLVKSAL